MDFIFDLSRVVSDSDSNESHSVPSLLDHVLGDHADGCMVANSVDSIAVFSREKFLNEGPIRIRPL
jgi:hypothetical protein